MSASRLSIRLPTPRITHYTSRKSDSHRSLLSSSRFHSDRHFSRPFPLKLHAGSIHNLNVGLRPDVESSASINESRPSTSGNGHLAGDRMRVAVDVDEVLGSFLETLNSFCMEAYGSHHDVSEFFVYDFRKIWMCSQAEANHRVHKFFDSQHFTNGIPPIPGAMDALKRISAHCDLVVVTSRQHAIRQPTLDWIEKHYPGIFQEVHFGNHFALEGAAKPKSEMCRSLGANLLIDDNPQYALECAEHGIHVLLFDWKNGYPWSKTECGPTHPLIQRVSDWEEAEGALRSFLLTSSALQVGEVNGGCSAV